MAGSLRMRIDGKREGGWRKKEREYKEKKLIY